MRTHNTHTHLYMCVCVYVYTHTHTHTHVYTRISITHVPSSITRCARADWIRLSNCSNGAKQSSRDIFKGIKINQAKTRG